MRVQDVYVSAGAGFIVVSLGAISFMPGARYGEIQPDAARYTVSDVTASGEIQRDGDC